MKLKAPFQYFGGKSKVADIVWQRFGRVDNYVEPFFGSGAVLLGRPEFDVASPFLETVNDKDCYVANFWRAMQAEPSQLAEIVDNPVNECDLEAWHKWLVTASRKAELERRCKDDPDYFDVTIAGRWCWGLCQWIGAGWCCGEWHGSGSGANFGGGVNVRDPERGGKLPRLGNNGQGVHKQRPHPGNHGRGVHPCSAWFDALAARMRRVRVCCGDWSRVTGDSVTIKHGKTAVFLDPPYATEANRHMDIYKEDSGEVARDVRRWAIEHGDDPLYRIALCGYEGEHEMPESWECVEWKAQGGMASQSKKADTQGKANKHRERIWFSPHCVKPVRQRSLFDEEQVS